MREGEDVQVHFLESFEDEISCYVKTPNHVNCNLKLTDVEKDTGCERIHYWSINGTCGFSIANVRKEDSGWWRLTSKDNNQKRIIDIADIKVLGIEGFKYLEINILHVNQYVIILRRMIDV